MILTYTPLVNDQSRVQHKSKKRKGKKAEAMTKASDVQVIDKHDKKSLKASQHRKNSAKLDEGPDTDVEESDTDKYRLKRQKTLARGAMSLRRTGK